MAIKPYTANYMSRICLKILISTDTDSCQERFGVIFCMFLLEVTAKYRSPCGTVMQGHPVMKLLTFPSSWNNCHGFPVSGIAPSVSSHILISQLFCHKRNRFCGHGVCCKESSSKSQRHVYGNLRLTHTTSTTLSLTRYFCHNSSNVKY
ncbi:hypothetical protein AVEN_186099-1 [Araneus ventricosus]|uniref:Uncharacterized protein n=1 Tax=Araneus ventricosus TaxID=182803 RepID=A0A4Y2PE61_ARAVE|nr:hypothetical protein AVEN_42061-1 [Araneus ventricosus]GBN49339.1 hypothetical protein AVEN_186099-1 [Araneus ventricosus]